MKKVILIPALLVAVVMMSCNATDSPETDSSIVPAKDTSTITTGNAIVDSAQLAQFANTVNPTTAAPATTQPVATATAVKTTGSSAPNPAHGQPGHRCDIAVGAPLNSPAGNTAQPGVQQTVTAPPSVAAPSTPTAISTDPNVKLNPAHGQPGHDCSIAVGAPLKKS